MPGVAISRFRLCGDALLPATLFRLLTSPVHPYPRHKIITIERPHSASQTAMNTIKAHALPEDDRLVQLARRIKNYRPVNPFYIHTANICIIVASVAGIIRFYKGWEFETAPILFHLCFWGGYLIGTTIQTWSITNDWRFCRVTKKFEQERLRRGIGPRDLSMVSDFENEKHIA